MQPCSHPLYGLIDCSKGMLGESLRAMIERARSSVTVVSGVSVCSSAGHPSSNGDRASVSKRPWICESAPRILVTACAFDLELLSPPDTVYMSSTAGNARFNVGLLAACQAMLMTNNATLIAINGLAGLALAPTPALATL